MLKLAQLTLFSIFFACWGLTEEITCEIKEKDSISQLFLDKYSLDVEKNLIQSGRLFGNLQLKGENRLKVIWAALEVKSEVINTRVMPSSINNWILEVYLTKEETTLIENILLNNYWQLNARLVCGNYLTNKEQGMFSINWDLLLPVLYKQEILNIKQLRKFVKKSLQNRLIISGDFIKNDYIEFITFYLRREFFQYIFNAGKIQLQANFTKKFKGVSTQKIKSFLYVEREILIPVQLLGRITRANNIREILFSTKDGNFRQEIKFWLIENLFYLWEINKIVIRFELHRKNKIQYSEPFIINKNNFKQNTFFYIPYHENYQLFCAGQIFKNGQKLIIPKTLFFSFKEKDIQPIVHLPLHKMLALIFEKTKK